MYPKIVLEHFAKPQNVGVIDNPSSIGEAVTVGGGKVIFYFLVRSNIVEKVKYQVTGCPYAIAVCSILSVYAKGKNVGVLKSVNRETIENFFHTPDDKIKCVDLALSAFSEGLKAF